MVHLRDTLNESLYQTGSWTDYALFFYLLIHPKSHYVEFSHSAMDRRRSVIEGSRIHAFGPVLLMFFKIHYFYGL